MYTKQDRYDELRNELTINVPRLTSAIESVYKAVEKVMSDENFFSTSVEDTQSLNEDITRISRSLGESFDKLTGAERAILQCFMQAYQRSVFVEEAIRRGSNPMNILLTVMMDSAVEMEAVKDSTASYDDVVALTELMEDMYS